MRILLLLATVASLGATAALDEALDEALYEADIDDLLRPYFSYLDKDGDHAVSVEDLTTLANELNLRTVLNDENLKSVFDSLDWNQDSRISYEDFDRLIGLYLNSIFQARIYQSYVTVTVHCRRQGIAGAEWAGYGFRPISEIKAGTLSAPAIPCRRQNH